MSEATTVGDLRPGGPRLTELLPVGAIRIGESAPDWRAAVRLAGDALVVSGATTSTYTEEMVEAIEQLGPYIVIAQASRWPTRVHPRPSTEPGSAS